MSDAADWVAPYKAPVFRDVGGVVFAETGFPPRVLITREFLHDANPQLVTRRGRHLRIRTANAGAWYLLARRFPYGVFGAVRLGREFPRG
jgi:hypothetical protein